MCPLIVWQEIVYLPNEYYCYVEYNTIRSSMWPTITTYEIPLTVLCTLYLHIVLFMRRQSNTQTLIIRNHQQRDFVVIQRIFISISILLVLGTPCVVMILMFYITNHLHPLFFRIAWSSVSLSMLILSVTLTVLTPQIKLIVWKKIQHNRVTPTNHHILTN